MRTTGPGVRRVVLRMARGLAFASLAVLAWILWRWPATAPVMAPPGGPGPQGVPELPLSSRAAVLIDHQSGQVLYAKNPDEPLPPASVTKIMTLMLALEAVHAGRVSMADEVVVSERAASMGGSQVWLEVGERMPLRDLLYAVAVGSANDASVAVAEYLAGSEEAFVELMNRRARELGMKNTRFANSTGLPPEEMGQPGPHVVSAQDLALLSRAAVRTPGLLEMVSTWEYTMRPAGLRKPVLYNFNRLLKRYPGVDGLKTGMTSAAGYCVAVTAVRDNLRLITVTMGAPTAGAREEDVRALLNYGFRRYEARRLASAGEPLARVGVTRGRPEAVQLVLAQDAFVTVERGTRLEVDTRVELPGVLVAPLPAGHPVGRVRLLQRDTGQVLAEVTAQTAQAVAVASALELTGRQVRTFLRVLAPQAGRRGAENPPK